MCTIVRVFFYRILELGPLAAVEPDRAEEIRRVVSAGCIYAGKLGSSRI